MRTETDRGILENSFVVQVDRCWKPGSENFQLVQVGSYQIEGDPNSEKNKKFIEQIKGVSKIRLYGREFRSSTSKSGLTKILKKVLNVSSFKKTRSKANCKLFMESISNFLKKLLPKYKGFKSICDNYDARSRRYNKILVEQMYSRGIEKLKESDDPFKSNHIMTTVNQGVVCNWGDPKIKSIVSDRKEFVVTAFGTRDESEYTPRLVSGESMDGLGILSRRINPQSYSSWEKIKEQIKDTPYIPFNRDFIKQCLKYTWASGGEVFGCKKLFGSIRENIQRKNLG